MPIGLLPLSVLLELSVLGKCNRFMLLMGPFWSTYCYPSSERLISFVIFAATVLPKFFPRSVIKHLFHWRTKKNPNPLLIACLGNMGLPSIFIDFQMSFQTEKEIFCSWKDTAGFPVGVSAYKPALAPANASDLQPHF